MQKKYALGIHHLNVAYCSGNIASYHRQVRESIVPLLDILHDHPNWCFNIEMCGASIEFIATNYPGVLTYLRDLINNGQIELISSMYAPQIWISFPQTDILKSIEINQKILKKYNIKCSRIFFSQENFINHGIKNLKEWFDIVVVKDDYYFYFHPYPQPFNATVPFYQLDDMKIVVGWGHILESLSSKLVNNQSNSSLNQLLLNQHTDLIKRSNDRHNSSIFTNFNAQYQDTTWTWYHYGSSERFSKPNIRPENHSTCFQDTNWRYKVIEILSDYESQGFTFTGIATFIDSVSLQAFTPEKSKLLLDGAWNMKLSKGTSIWNENGKDYEDVLAVRNYNWLSRSRIMGVESLLRILNIQPNKFEWIFIEIEKAWRHQLLAESSDATGWYPEQCEVFDSINHSDIVLNLLNKILVFIKLTYKKGALIVDSRTDMLLDNLYCAQVELKPLSYQELLIPPPVCYGIDCKVNFYEKNTCHQIIHIDFIPLKQKSSVEFIFNLDSINYSPTLMDNEILNVRISEIEPQSVLLSLSNGLIEIAPDIYLIKHNEFLNIACCIEEGKISFNLINPKIKPTHWEFTIFKGQLKKAIEIALSINIYPIVHL